MNQAENRTPGNVPEQRTYKVEDIAISKPFELVMPYEFPKNHLTNG